MEIKPIGYEHYKNKEMYFKLDTCKIQENGKWLEAIIYSNTSGKKFCRTENEFEKKFIPIFKGKLYERNTK